MIWWLKKQLLKLKLYAYENYQKEAESLIVWYAISFAFGALFYFAYPYEISVWTVTIVLEIVLVLLYLNRKDEVQFKILTYIATFMLGLCITKADAMHRYNNLDHNIKEMSYIEGYIKDIDYNSNQRPRLHLTKVNNYKEELKGDFRISTNYLEEDITTGKCIELVAKFPKRYTPNPISNYNQERTNFYKGIKSGYAISPIFIKDCQQKPNYITVQISNIRNYIKEVIKQNTDKKTGSIITALTIGDMSQINKEQSDNYRISGLAHFLSISGMHMGIIAILAFFLVRSLLFPLGKGQYDTRKVATIISITSMFLYFLISGQSVSCIRAFIMTTLILTAIMLNRRAISLRIWALALIIVVAINPSAVVSAGFLMSFSAVLGLTAFYEKNAQKLYNWFKARNIIGKIGAYLLGVMITDIVASLMTMPYSMYYFQQISIYTTLGNLLAAPIIAFCIMPTLLLFLLSIPLGLGAYTIKPLSLSIDIINKITEYVSSLPLSDVGNNLGIISDWSIFILTFGLLWLCIWQEKWRYWGIVGILCGVLSSTFAIRPDFVFDENGKTYAYKNSNNRLQISPYNKNKFLERIWTGTKTQKEDIEYKNKDINCDDEKCIYKNRIEFNDKYLKFDNKNIELKSGGYISLKTGVHYYTQKQNRLWNKD